jgi:hypothetical protein
MTAPSSQMTREWAGRREQLRLVLGRGELSLSASAQALLFGTPPMRRLGHFLTEIGDRHGIPRLSYNPANFLWWHGAQLSSATRVARALDAAFPSATRYADIRAGSGVFGAALARRGKVVVACEHYRVGRWLARRQGLEVLPFDLTRDPPADLGGPVDVAFCSRWRSTSPSSATGSWRSCPLSPQRSSSQRLLQAMVATDT